jgi:hypothetical protein
MKKILFYFLLLVSNDVMSQGTHAQTKIAPFFLFDTYYSFIGNRGADVWGFKAGITWNNKWKFGAGFNKIKSDIVEEKALPSDEVGYSIDDTVRSQLYLRYYPLMAEYTFYEKDDWQISRMLSEENTVQVRSEHSRYGSAPMLVRNEKGDWYGVIYRPDLQHHQTNQLFRLEHLLYAK